MPKPVRKMPQANAAAQAAVLPRIPPELPDQVVKGPMTAAAVEDASRAFKMASPADLRASAEPIAVHPRSKVSARRAVKRGPEAQAPHRVALEPTPLLLRVAPRRNPREQFQGVPSG